MKKIENSTFFEIYIRLYNIVTKYKWTGGCHSLSAILYVVAKKLNILNCELKIGVASIDGYEFDHSWLEINGQIYDIAIAMPIEMEFSRGPIYADIDLNENIKTDIKYGDSCTTLDEPAASIAKIDIYSYIKNSDEIDLIKVIKDICEPSKIYITNSWLKNNFSNVYRTVI